MARTNVANLQLKWVTDFPKIGPLSSRLRRSAVSVTQRTYFGMTSTEGLEMDTIFVIMGFP
jgi:hypothetical protein